MWGLKVRLLPLVKSAEMPVVSQPAGTLRELPLALLRLLRFGQENSDQELAELSARLRALQEQYEALQDTSWELHESEERYRSLGEAFGDVLLHRDEQNRVTFANSAFYDTFMTGEIEPENATFEANFIEEFAVPSPIGHGPVREVKINTNFGEAWFVWIDMPFRDQVTGKKRHPNGCSQHYPSKACRNRTKRSKFAGQGSKPCEIALPCQCKS